MSSILQVKDTSTGEWINIPALIGPSGAQGNPGKDGVGVASVSQTTVSTVDGGDNVLTVTLTNGTSTKFTVKNGSTGSAGANGNDGKTPVKGVDYWTTTDQESIVQQVIAALQTPVFGRVDDRNNIILTGELADGVYTLKYENADGEVVVIGTLEHTDIPEPTYINLITTAINRDGTPYVGDYGEVGYRTGYRVKSDDSEVANSVTSCTGFIPITNYNQKLYFSNITTDSSSNDNTIVLYDSTFTRVGQNMIKSIYAQVNNQQIIDDGITFSNDGNLLTMTVYGLRYWHSIDNLKKTAYIRLTAQTITDDSVISVEPIA